MAALIDNLFLSVGAMKAGTTWMQRVLELHPEIYFTPEKEIHYFAHAYMQDGTPLSAQARLARARQYIGIDPQNNTTAGVRARLLWTANYLSEPVDDLWYRNLFTFRGRKTWCADFSNLYAHLDEPAWKRVRGGVDRLRVIYTMRDPIKRLWSHAKFHSQFIGKADEVTHWTPEVAEAFLRRNFMWKHAEYGQTVRLLREGLATDELRVFFFENLHKDQTGWLREVEDLLTIAHHDYPQARLSARVNESFDAPMPDWFAGLFRADVERICSELRDQGLQAPASWTKYFDAGSAAA
ncbi:sulfotransferase [Aurantimonas sp. VKM B-3413]|uniref:sulfotransferase n=1 Tax=Aurantimonas sp. VKM B-3413 TaxID=2779401 RepID=UPI001E58C8D8|nr:sulfotransferase [Aurantimonas sp. VKM B-3413]MCB8836483.1 sulfotransferase [Aurantimonas sp. VKM B-3413]